MKIGMFGGAFDPPHRAHLALAEAALRQLRLDRVYAFPTGEAWHKQRPLSPAEDRLAMAQLAFADAPQVTVDDRELRRPGPTYSIDTLRELRAEHPGAELVLLMGEDQADGFQRWQAWDDIVRIATLAVAGRGEGEGAGIAALRALPGARVESLQLPRMPVSATEIRTRLAAGEDITRLVDPRVASYIARHHLYSPT